MKEKNISRRDFFKCCTKVALPIIGGMVLGSSKVFAAQLRQVVDCENNCSSSCRSTCSTGCLNTCKGMCMHGCTSSCKGGCSKSCQYTCKVGCKNSTTSGPSNSDKPWKKKR